MSETGRRPRMLALVLLGGIIGTAGREGVNLALPTEGDVPWALLLINLAGSFLLGLLVTVVGPRASESPARRDVRLFVGTGVLGGFTTYSALAAGTAGLVDTAPALAVAYPVASIALGVVAAGAGIRAGESGAMRRATSRGRP